MMRRIVSGRGTAAAPAVDEGAQAPAQPRPRPAVAAPAAPAVNPVLQVPPVPAPPPPPTATAPAPTPAIQPQGSAPIGDPVAQPATLAQPGVTHNTAGMVNVNTAGYTPAAGAFGAEGIGSQIEKYGSDAMKAPSRFDSDLVKQGLGVINKDAEVATGNRMRALSELMAKRGLVGSSVEGDTARGLLSDIEQTRARSALDLGLEQARTFASDRTAAGALGQNAGEFERELGGDRENANRYGYEAGRSAGREAESTRQFEKGYGLQERAQTADERNNDLMMLLRAMGMLTPATA